MIERIVSNHRTWNGQIALHIQRYRYAISSARQDIGEDNVCTSDS